MTILSLFPARIRFVDKDGLLTQEAVRALAKLFERVGGFTGPSVIDLSQADDDDSGLEEFKHETAKALDGLAMAPVAVPQELADPLHPLAPQHHAYEDHQHLLAYAHPEVEQLLSEVSELRAQVAEMRKQIQGLLEGTTL